MFLIGLTKVAGAQSGESAASDLLSRGERESKFRALVYTIYLNVSLHRQPQLEPSILTHSEYGVPVPLIKGIR